MDPASEAGSDADVQHDLERAQTSMVKKQRIYYIQFPEKVHKLLDVVRYSTRWFLIPKAELHASSVNIQIVPSGAGFSILAGCPSETTSRTQREVGTRDDVSLALAWAMSIERCRFAGSVLSASGRDLRLCHCAV